MTFSLTYFKVREKGILSKTHHIFLYLSTNFPFASGSTKKKGGGGWEGERGDVAKTVALMSPPAVCPEEFLKGRPSLGKSIDPA